MKHNCPIYGNKHLHFKDRSSVPSHQILGSDVSWSMKTNHSTFHPDLHQRKLCKAPGAEKKKSSKQNTGVPWTTQELGVCFNTRDAALSRKYHWRGFHTAIDMARLIENSVNDGLQSSVFVMKMATELKQSSNVKIGLKYVLPVTS